MPTNFDARKQTLCHQDALYLILCRPNSQKPLALYSKKTHHFWDCVRYIRRDISVFTLQRAHATTHCQHSHEFENHREVYSMCNHHSVKLTYTFWVSTILIIKKYKKANLITAKLKTISKSFKGQLPLCLCKVTLMHILINCKW